MTLPHLRLWFWPWGNGGGEPFLTAPLEEVLEYRTFRDVKEAMTNLGVYREEFDPVIRVYLNTLDQYDKTFEEFQKDGRMLIDCRSGQKKNPLLVMLEGLKKEIITYSDRLCLNPKSYDQVKNAKNTEEKTGLAEALASFDELNL